jgi:YVTN family beta-propeller protein
VNVYCARRSYCQFAAALFLLLIVISQSKANAQNFPPVAKATPLSEEAFLGQALAFSSTDSIDPDEGPQPLTYFWEFGDGATSTEANPSHFYSEPRAYRVRLTVSDGLDSAIDSVVVHVLAPPTPVPPTRSSLLTLNPSGTELWVVNPDANSVSVLSVTSDTVTKLAEITVGRQPRTLAFSRDGARVFVACQGTNELWVVNAPARNVSGRIPVGHQPYGVAVSPGDGTILVSNQGDGTVSVISSGLVVKRIFHVADTPRALAVTADGSRAYLTHFLTRGGAGMVTEIDLPALSVSRTAPLVEDASPDTTSSGGGFPNLLGALAIDPSGHAAWFGGLKANTGRGLFVNGETPHPENTVRGFFGKLDLAGVTEELDRRIDANDSDSVSAIAFSPSGRWAYVTHQGAGTLSVYDLSAATLIRPGDGNTVSFAARIDLGHAPQGIVVSADGRRGYVANYLSRDVQVIDLNNPRMPAVTSTVPVTSEPLPANVANGKRQFYRSREPQHSRANYIACASCHADGGGHDGRTWDFTNRGEGVRNTTDLRGSGGMAHGPVHWSGNFDEIQDFENDIVCFFGGTGLAQDGQPPNPPLGAPNTGRSADLDDLAAYVSSLSEPAKSPFRNQDGTLTDAALRGKALFLSPALQCASCHVPPRFTDSVVTPDPANFVRHDVGTLTPASGSRLGGPLDGLDTPSLLALWDSAPYLHDGSAATLLDVLTARNPSDRHGVTSMLSSNQLDELAAYLFSLDGSTVDEDTDGDGDGMSDQWEQLHGLNPASADDADDDTDGDGASNRDEFLAGTDPTNPWSRLFIHEVKREAGALSFFFHTVKGKSYVGEYTDSLPALNWQSLGSVAGDGTEQVITDTNPPPSQRFYRIRIMP